MSFLVRFELVLKDTEPFVKLLVWRYVMCHVRSSVLQNHMICEKRPRAKYVIFGSVLLQWTDIVRF